MLNVGLALGVRRPEVEHVEAGRNVSSSGVTVVSQPEPHSIRRPLKKGLARPRNKDLRQEFDREIRTYVDDRDFFSGLIRA